jgi:hypothetical protein
VAGRQGGGTEIMRTMREMMRANECNSETKKSRFEECQVASGVRPEKVALPQRLK